MVSTWTSTLKTCSQTQYLFSHMTKDQSKLKNSVSPVKLQTFYMLPIYPISLPFCFLPNQKGPPFKCQPSTFFFKPKTSLFLHPQLSLTCPLSLLTVPQFLNYTKTLKREEHNSNSGYYFHVICF